MNILKKIEEHFGNAMPFVVYRKPNKKIVSGFFMNSTELEFASTFSESGFVFAPFESVNMAILFSEKEAELISENVSIENLELKTTLDFSIDESARENHIKIVAKAVEQIKNSSLQKVVLSRKETIALKGFDVVEVYKKLLQKYENAFVYVWFHPEVGMWLGATPETLVKVDDYQFRTMSLAGTKKNEAKNTREWTSKELEEQQLVTDFIENQIKNISVDLDIGKTETTKAGRLFHLKTTISGRFKKSVSLNQLIKALHPTPAICGLPRDFAKKFIVDHENYQRSYYTGFLGEVNLEKRGIKSSSLFVNLRCMEILENTIEIYVGGGITKDSIPLKEWEETVSKSETMKSVL